MPFRRETGGRRPGFARIKPIAEAAGWNILRNVVVSVSSEDNHIGVVRDTNIDGSNIAVLMLSGPQEGTHLQPHRSHMTPVQPHLDVLQDDLETVKILDDQHHGKYGKLVEVIGQKGNEHGVVRFGTGEVATLHVSLIAKCVVP